MDTFFFFYIEFIAPCPQTTKPPWVSRDVGSWITEYVEQQVDSLVTMHPSIFKENDKILG